MSRWLRRLAAAACLIGCPAAARAQAIQPLGGRHFEVAIGGQWLGGVSLGSKDASLSTGTGAPFKLFATSSSFGSTGGLEARIAVPVSRRFEAEGFGAYARPTIDTLITNDVESASTTTATDSVKQFMVGGGVLWYLPPRFQKPRLRPFVLGSAAYLRELHDSETLAVNGMSFDGGGGVKFVLRERRSGRLRSAGLRADGRLQVLVNGVTFNGGDRYRPVLTASAFFRY